MASAVSVERTNNQDIDGILSGRRWDSLNLTYSFPKDASLYGDAYGWGEARDNFGALGEGQSAVTRHILGTISAVTNLDFAEIELGQSFTHLACIGGAVA